MDGEQVGVCCWCDEPIYQGQLYLEDEPNDPEDNDLIHATCQAEEYDGYDLDNSFGAS